MHKNIAIGNKDIENTKFIDYSENICSKKVLIFERYGNIILVIKG